MACSAERLTAVVLLAVTLPGCVTGHVLDAARRRERPLAIEGAVLQGERVTLRYTAEVIDDDGTARGTVQAAAAVPVATLRAPTSPPADAIAPEWRPPAATDGEGVVLLRGTSAPAGVCAGPTLEIREQDGRDTALVWRDAADAPPWAPVPVAGLTRMRTAPWAWPLVPPALAVDAIVTPVLLFFAPAVMVIGE